MPRLLHLYAPPLAWMAVVWLSSNHAVPDDVATIPDWLTHGTTYLILAVLWLRAFTDGFRRAADASLAFAAVGLCVGFGVADEIHQSRVPQRQGDPWDVAKDLGGATIGALAVRLANRPPREQVRSGGEEGS